MFDKRAARRDLRRLDKARDALAQAENAVRGHRGAFMRSHGVFGADEHMLRRAVS